MTRQAKQARQAFGVMSFEGDAGWRLSADDGDHRRQLRIEVDVFRVGTVDAGEALDVTNDACNALGPTDAIVQQVTQIIDDEVEVELVPAGGRGRVRRQRSFQLE